MIKLDRDPVIRKLRLQCIRAGSVLPRRGEPEEQAAWDEGERQRRGKDDEPEMELARALNGIRAR